MKKNIGILLPLSALPGPHGIGDFGQDAYFFIDFLSKNHYKYWQILPLNPLGNYNSPYMSTCSLAIDHRYISLDLLSKEGLLNNDIKPYFKDSSVINYDLVSKYKMKYLHKAYFNYSKGNMDGLKKFKTNNPWVVKYATYEVFKKKNNNEPWNKWNKMEKNYFKFHSTAPNNYLDEINFVVFIQYVALRQYKHLLAYAKKRNIKIIADVPFYVGFDSMEVWLNKDEFFIQKDEQTLEAGVPPDAFSKTGQMWGNPIYDFSKMRNNNYSLLVERIGELGKRCDLLRLDHFRAFDTYFVIPKGEETALNGHWESGPGLHFFRALKHFYPDVNLLAEDLGDLFPSVHQLRNELNMPGMYIVQFNIFDKNNVPNEKCIVYPGTHDNDTLLGWFKSLDLEQLKYLKSRFKERSKKRLYDKIFKYIVSLPSMITIIPMQDLLGLDSNARINTPGTTKKENWTYKMKSFSELKNIKFKVISI